VPVEFGGAQQTVERRGSLAAGITAREQEILSIMKRFP
jgi:hypothetical protein